MSDFVKTVQRQATGAGRALASPSRTNAASTASSRPWSACADGAIRVAASRSACWSMNEPVPEAQGPFIAKCSRRQSPPSQASAKSAASCPPMARIVRAPGATWTVPTICATVSGSQGAARRAAISRPCEPVKVTERRASPPKRSRTAASAARTASTGRPKWRR